MHKYNLIIFKFKSLYEILKELNKNLNFNIFEAPNEIILNNFCLNLKDYLIITKKNTNYADNQLVLNGNPLRFSKLLEQINIQYLKVHFNKKSDFKIGRYILDTNSREIILNNIRLKLTEKEIDTIIYLSKSTSAVAIKKLQTEVWSHQSELETHTVETHIYRLRKKILETYNDDKFIISHKDGYKII